jgi:hypothetical protein
MKKERQWSPGIETCLWLENEKAATGFPVAAFE